MDSSMYSTNTNPILNLMLYKGDLIVHIHNCTKLTGLLQRLIAQSLLMNHMAVNQTTWCGVLEPALRPPSTSTDLKKVP